MLENLSISNGNICWAKDFLKGELVDKKEIEQIKIVLLKTIKLVSISRVRLYPVRTNNLKNFAKDFFLPTTVNNTISDIQKMQSTVEKIMRVIQAFSLDVITFPIRFLTCVPRIIINYLKKEDPLLTYLKRQNDDSATQLSKMDQVHVYYIHNRIHQVKRNYDFIEVPIYRNAYNGPRSIRRESVFPVQFPPCLHQTKPTLFEEKAEWKKTLKGEEITKVLKYLQQNNRRTVGTFQATLYPVRTNNLKNFTKDFFLPTTVNHTLHIRNIAIRVMGVVLSLGFDTITFPIRLLTCFPRIIVNLVMNYRANFFAVYLKQQDDDVAKKLATLDHVKVSLLSCERVRRVMYHFIMTPTYENDFLDIDQVCLNDNESCDKKGEILLCVSAE